MNARTLATICALLAALSNLIGCESLRSPDPQFQKQVMRAQECRQLQDKLVGDQPLTPERGEEIANTMEGAGCTARLPSADAGVRARFPGSKMTPQLSPSPGARPGQADFARRIPCSL